MLSDEASVQSLMSDPDFAIAERKLSAVMVKRQGLYNQINARLARGQSADLQLSAQAILDGVGAAAKPAEPTIDEMRRELAIYDQALLIQQKVVANLTRSLSERLCLEGAGEFVRRCQTLVDAIDSMLAAQRDMRAWVASFRHRGIEVSGPMRDLYEFRTAWHLTCPDSDVGRYFKRIREVAAMAPVGQESLAPTAVAPAQEQAAADSGEPKAARLRKR